MQTPVADPSYEETLIVILLRHEFKLNFLLSKLKHLKAIQFVSHQEFSPFTAMILRMTFDFGS